ncbi:GNAT family N-acetyltransferase [Streptomyces sp. NPDC088197]|uniref:GNAT family N-acetyltransferase n=1 Tax=Streptomyces sp. NPDC088197 TaxID=3365840 RepID=UPI00381D9ABC
MMLRGYRGADLPLLTGHWLPGELLGLSVPGRPVLAEPARVPAPEGPGEDGAPGQDDELCVVPGTGFVRLAALDWVHRRARLEIGLRPGAETSAEPLLKAALDHAFRVLGLSRVFGWVTPAVPLPDGLPRDALLRDAGLSPEADIPRALWLDGRPVARQIWGATRHG